MPSWSTRIASELVLLAIDSNASLNQAKLQKLIYIAHGLQLAATDQPLSGDRPEAWAFGPIYRRVAQALRSAGNEPLGVDAARRLVELDTSDLDQSERDLIARVYEDYAGFTNAELSQLTRRGRSPWSKVYAAGKGEGKDISHLEIRKQFVELASRIEHDPRKP